MLKQLNFPFKGLFIFLYVISSHILLAQNYEVSLNSELKEGYLYLSYEAIRTSEPEFAFGTSYFSLRLDSSIFNGSKAEITEEGVWSFGNNQDYKPLTISYSSQYNVLALKITKDPLRFGGTPLSYSKKLIGTVRIPLKKCLQTSSLKWLPDPVTHVTDFRFDNDITSSGTFTGLTSLPSCQDPDGTLSATPSTTLCPGQEITFSVKLNKSVADSIIFYRNNTIVQKGTGTQTTFKTTDYKQDDEFYAIVKFCSCEKKLNVIKMDVLSGTSVNLGKDTSLCAGQTYLLDASGTFNSLVSYEWSTGATSSSITVSNGGEYWVRAYTSACEDFDTININYIPVITEAANPQINKVSVNSLEFSWSPVSGAESYYVSVDGSSWVPANGTTTHTLSSLSSETEYCLKVKAANKCDSTISNTVCATTLKDCKVTYTKTLDTSACRTPYEVELYVKDINIPTFKISWSGNPFGTSTTYKATGNATQYVNFTITDSLNTVSCHTEDSIKITYSPSDATWSGLNSEYCVSGFPSKLSPNYEGGRFLGEGVFYDGNISSWVFDPAKTTPGSHVISYVLCGDTVSYTTTVNPAPCVTTPVYGGADGSTLVSQPQGIFTTCDGSIYYTNTDSSKIYRITPYGEIELMAGPAGLNNPTALVVHPNNGDIYFCDTKNHQIKKVDGITKAVSLIAGSTIGFADNADGSLAQFNSPLGLAFGPNLEYAYVADKNNGKIRKVSLTPPYSVSTFAGSGATGNLGSVTFSSIAHLSIDSANLYVSDPVNLNIIKINLTNETYSYVTNTQFGYSDGTGTAYKLRQPTGISADGSGNVYFTDTDNHSIRIASGNSVKTVAGKFPTIPEPGYVDGTGSDARFNSPTALSVFVRGYIDVADTENNAIRRISIEDWRTSPFNGFTKLYCAYDDKDTLIPLYNGGYYVASPVNASVTKEADGNWYFDPKVAGPGNHRIGYIYKVGYCTDTFYTEVFVGAPPIPSLGPDSVVCENEIGKYTLDAGGDFATINWYRNGTKISGETSRYLIVQNIGEYIVEVADTIGCIGRDTVNITSQVVPAVDLGPDVKICSGDTATLTPLISSTDISGYIWNNGSTDSILHATSSGYHFVQVWFNSGCKQSDSILVTVNPLPDVKTGKDTTVCLGDTASLLVESMSSVLTYNWLPSISLDNPTIHNPVASPSANTNYQVTVTDTNNCSNTAEQFIYISSPSSVVTANPSTICPEDSIQLWVSTYGGSGDSLNYLYSWNYPASLNNPNIQGPKASSDTTRKYVVTVTDSLGCQSIGSVKVNIISPATTAGTDQAICLNDSVSIGSGTSDTSFIYSWSPVAGLNDPTVLSPKASPAATTDYILTVQHKSLGCITKDTVQVKVHNLPAIDGGNDLSVCLGDSATLTATPVKTSYTYLWSPGPALTSVNTFETKAYPGITTKYFIEVTDSNSCINKDSVTVQVKSPTATISITPGEICPVDSAQLTGAISGGTGSPSSWQFLWSPSLGLSDPNISNPKASPGATQTYSVTITDSIGCKATTSQELKVKDFTANAGPDKEVCPGESAIIGPSTFDPALYSFSWSPSTGLSSANVAQPTATPGTDTQYALTITDNATSCTARDSVWVRLKDIGKIITPDTSICLYDTVQLKLNKVDPGFNYNWSPNVYISDVTEAQPSVYPANDTTYIVTVNDNAGCEYKDTVSIKVVDLAIYSFFYGGKELCVGDTATVDIISANPVSSYSWTPSSSVIKTGSNRFKVFPDQDAEFKIVGINSLGCESNELTETVKVVNPIINAGNDTSICIGEQVTIGSPATLGYSYSWSPNTYLDDASKAEPIASLVADQKYTLTVTAPKSNGVGSCSVSDSISVTVNNLPVANAGNDTTICANTTTNLLVIPNGAGYSYSWSPGTTLNNATIANPAATPTGNTEYIVELTDSNGCKDLDTVRVLLDSVVVNATSGQVTACPGTSFQVSAGSSNSISTWEWTPTTEFSDPASAVTNAVIYSDSKLTVRGSNTRGCWDTASVFIQVQGLSVFAGNDTTICSGSSISLNATPIGGSGSVTYSWSPASEFTDPTLKTVVANPVTGTNEYIVSVDDGVCNNKDTIVVTATNPPSVDAGPETDYLCEGSQKNIGGAPTATGNSPFTYSWSIVSGSDNVFSNSSSANPLIGPVSDAVYALEVTDNFGCTGKDSTKVVLNSKPDATINPANLAACTGTDLTLSVNTVNNTNIIQWYEANSPSASDTTAITINSSGTYSVLVTNLSTGCKDSASYNANFLTAPAITGYSGEGTFCANDTIELSVSATGDNLVYKWISTEGNFSSPDSANTEFNKSTSEAAFANFTVSISNACDTVNQNIPVTFMPAPVASFFPDSDSVMINQPVQFTNNSDSANYTWNWTFGNGNSAITKDASQTYVSGGNYLVSLLAENSQGCKDTYSVLLEVIEKRIVYVPNIITPSASNPENRVFKVYGTSISDNSFKINIYNRWGELIFSSSDFSKMSTNGWEGVDSKGKVQNGVYTYVLKGMFVDGSPFEKTGTITVVR